MTTIKAYTSIEQSKKLAEILPKGSADMRYGYIAPYDYSDRMYDGGYDEVPYPKDFLKKNPNFSENEYDGELPCWSLAALLDALNKTAYFMDEDTSVNLSSYKTIEWDLGIDNSDLELATESNPIDACYEMIIKLKEQNLL